eukprot:TRINITY_DN15806_c1_g1_i6.p4 TRINITY_DN15806_c1_g1~~TRINITY_DN15806_c1_g1_i6.p4  ORF type:complete len:119 (+),score=0.37 TRINITY_DN15806_c1_g1_i6:637-993(+)
MQYNSNHTSKNDLKKIQQPPPPRIQNLKVQQVNRQPSLTKISAEHGNNDFKFKILKDRIKRIKAVSNRLSVKLDTQHFHDDYNQMQEYMFVLPVTQHSFFISQITFTLFRKHKKVPNK